MFGAIVRAVTGGGGGGSGGKSGGLRTVKNQGASIARQQILDYTGHDFLGKAGSMALTVDNVAQLEDIRRYVAEQKELLTYAAKKLESITNDVSEIEFMISEIIVHQLKTRAEVDKFITKTHLAGDRYGAHTAKLNQQYSNQQKLIAGETAGEMALDNVETKLKLLRLKSKYDLKKQNAQVSHNTELRNVATTEAENATTRKEAEARRMRLAKGDGKTPTGVGFTRFKSQL